MLEMNADSPSPVITIRENKIMRTPLMDAVKETQEVTQKIHDRDFAGAMVRRDAEFKEYYHAYLNTSTPDHPKLHLPEGKVDKLRISFVM